MSPDTRFLSSPSAKSVRILALTLVVTILGPAGRAQEPEITAKLQGFDSYMEQVIKDWNTPGIGVGIVINDRLVFAKGYGYRDYEKKQPFTPATLCQIASNTKLFTAVAAGMLVEEGKLAWDKPVRESVPTIQFYNDQLNNNVTLRDMLSHRTGVTRHDLIWFKSDFTRAELFEKLRYLEPQQPMRETFLYNNLMFSAVGQIIELRSGTTWEQFVRERILVPLDMNTTTYTISDMVQHPDHGVPYREKRDSFELYKIPYYEDTQCVAPAGAIISNIDELSHWLIALMNDGKYNGKQVLPASVLKATLPTRHRVTEHAGGVARILAITESRLWHGTTNRRLPRTSDNLPRRRPSRVSFPGFLPAQRPDRRDRLGDRRSQRSSIQRRELQRV